MENPNRETPKTPQKYSVPSSRPINTAKPKTITNPKSVSPNRLFLPLQPSKPPPPPKPFRNPSPPPLPFPAQSSETTKFKGSGKIFKLDAMTHIDSRMNFVDNGDPDRLLFLLAHTIGSNVWVWFEN